MIYLDHNATTPCAFDEELLELSGKPLNPSSVHSFGRSARGMLERARKSVCQSLCVNTLNHSLIFTGSGTEANNLVVKSFEEGNIFALATEHSSILNNPYVKTISVDSSGTINIDHLIQLLETADLSKKTLVCVMFANNETGTIQPLKKVKDVVRYYGVNLHSDCIQGLGKMPLNFDDIGADSISISAHKCGGLAGIGALLYKNSLPIIPQILGGGQERGVRAGTESVIHAHLFAKASIRANDSCEVYFKTTKALRDKMEEEIGKICKEAIFVSESASRLPNTSTIIMPKVSAQIQLMRFDLAGFAISSGSACSSGKIGKSHVLLAMGLKENQINSAIRVSFGMDNTLKETEAFIETWATIYRDFM